MKVLPGLLLAAALAILGNILADYLAAALGFGHGAISGIMVAILLGLALGNLAKLPEAFSAGISFAVKRVLRLGIVLLGLRLSIAEVGSIGLKTLPVVLVTVPAAILIVSFLGKRIKLSDRLATLIAVGTSICGNTAIVAVAPTIGAKDEETSYAVACITVFGLVAMLAYPFAAHWLFSGDAFSAGLFLGTAVHDTSQVAGAGMVYQQYYHAPQALDVATVAKLERNLSMLIVIPLMSILYHRRAATGTAAAGLVDAGAAVRSGFRRNERDPLDRGPGWRPAVRPARCRAVEELPVAGVHHGELLPRHRDGRRRPGHQRQGPEIHRLEAARTRPAFRPDRRCDQPRARQDAVLIGSSRGADAQSPLAAPGGSLRLRGCQGDAGADSLP